MVTGEQFVQQHAERKLIGARIGWFAPEDLRRDITGRAGWLTRAGQGFPCSLTLACRNPREAEVDHFDPAVRQVHHVLRLQVPVDDAARMRRGQRVRNGPRDGHHLVDRQQSVSRAQGVAQRDARDVLVHQVQVASELLQGVDSGNPGM